MENTSMLEAPASLIGSPTGEVTSHVFHGREAAAQARSSGHRWEWSPGASSGRFVSSYRRAPIDAIVVQKQWEPRIFNLVYPLNERLLRTCQQLVPDGADLRVHQIREVSFHGVVQRVQGYQLAHHIRQTRRQVHGRRAIGSRLWW